MTKQRVFGEDKDFMDWLRSCKNLPSRDVDFGLSVTDVDCVLHRYMECVDSYGTRRIQSMMQIEVKTRSGVPDFAQKDTYFKQHFVLTNGGISKAYTSRFGESGNRVLIWHWGVSYVRMSGTQPDDSLRLWWGRYDAHGEIEWRSISHEELIGLLRFELHPQSLAKNPFRRHHKTRTLIRKEIAELGFPCERLVEIRS